MNIWESIKQAPWYHLLENPKKTMEELFHLSEPDFNKFDEIFKKDDDDVC